jgi:hypothetical protein
MVTMTDEQIIAEFERIEAAANKTPQGADHEHILHVVTAKSGRDLSYVRRLIIDNTFTTPN